MSVVDFSKGKWIHKPKKYTLNAQSVSITTEPATDLWQRSYYGFRNDNAPGLLIESDQDFTFAAKVGFAYHAQFDQCGLLIYIDSENWFKASIEYETDGFSRLGSVVTNAGYSDWATTDISLPAHIWFRLSRRGPDFLIESSPDGEHYNQMRIFHLHTLGETTEDMGKHNRPPQGQKAVRFGVYACSPADSSFTATFSNMGLEPCTWLAHSG